MPGEINTHEAYIALGSNLGDREANLKSALKNLDAEGIEILAVSSFLSSEPYGVTDQPEFLNAVCKVRTILEPLKLLRTLLAIETKMGRVRLRHWGERNIDLDLLFYEDEVISTDELKLPHPDLQNRSFVLTPLNEIAADLVHPVFGKNISDLLKMLNAEC